MARVTVAMAVFNGASHLAEALDAVLAQTYRDFDVLVLNDGSTDNSAEIAARYDVRLVTQANAGLGEARRRMVELATGDYVAFVDHDDFWTPEKLTEQMAVIDATDADLVHSDGWYRYEDGREVARDLEIPDAANAWDHILPNNRVIASTAVFRREAMLAAGNFVADTVRCSDWYGWMRLAPTGRFRHLPRRHVHYNVLSTSLANAGFRFHAAQLYVLERYFWADRAALFGGLPDSLRRRYEGMVTEQIGIALSAMARHERKRGHRAEARRLAIRAVRTAPRVPKVWTRALSVLI
ncbi:MAG: glycosyltransferase [Fimbriimonadaceae bacterium]|nr:glycosyltransferase [Fimbriimonadaceae bacterium]